MSYADSSANGTQQDRVYRLEAEASIASYVRAKILDPDGVSHYQRRQRIVNSLLRRQSEEYGMWHVEEDWFWMDPEERMKRFQPWRLETLHCLYYDDLEGKVQEIVAAEDAREKEERKLLDSRESRRPRPTITWEEY